MLASNPGRDCSGHRGHAFPGRSVLGNCPLFCELLVELSIIAFLATGVAIREPNPRGLPGSGIRMQLKHNQSEVLPGNVPLEPWKRIRIDPGVERLEGRKFGFASHMFLPLKKKPERITSTHKKKQEPRQGERPSGIASSRASAVPIDLATPIFPRYTSH